jgi:uncharacterized protein (DUF736 family)
MAKIGTFKKQNDGRFTGTINTLTIRAAVELAPVEAPDGNDPNFRAWSNGTEIGAAWMQQSKAGNPYLSVKLDDPSLPAWLAAGHPCFAPALLKAVQNLPQLVHVGGALGL